MLRFQILGLVSCSMLLGGCSAPAAETEADTQAFTAEDARCFREQPQTGESATDARARCLTSYADTLLNAQMARREDPRDAALASYVGKLRVPAETGCFTEDVRGSAIGAWQNDIDSERDVGSIGVQLKASVEMLKYFVRDLDGYPNHLFESVEICPNGQVGGDLALTGSRLRVGMRTGWFGSFGVHTSTTMRAKWTSGEHLAQDAALASLKGERWGVVDPVGTPRTALRKALRGIVTRVRERLDRVAALPEGERRAEVESIVNAETAPDVAAENGAGNVRERALAKISAMSAEELADLAQRWSVDLSRSEVTDGIEESSVKMRDVLNQRDVRVNVSQSGLVNVQNVHQISVDLDVFLPRAASFSRFVEATRTETTIDVNQFGLVNVQTNDLITVRVQVLYGRSVQTASLARVIGS